MYTPVQDGIEKAMHSVCYNEVAPPHDLSVLVHCFWELKTTATLTEDFKLHAVPDACVDIMFNEIDTSIAGVTTLRTKYEVLNLGKKFHYVGIEFLPGVWQGPGEEIAHHYIGTSYTGRLPLVATNREMTGLDFADKQHILASFVRQLADQKIVKVHPLMRVLLENLDTIYTVTDMANITRLSTRQLQRVIRRVTGFSPHDFLKVLRLQRAMKRGYPMLYSDQSHFIRSFKAITGYTPTEYFSKFDV